MRMRAIARRPISAVMYSHDGVGLGHLRRNLNIARCLVGEDAEANVLMVIGCASGILFDCPDGVDYVKLPSVVKVKTNTWNSRGLRISQERIRDLRSKLILRVVELFEPNLFLTDHMPAGVWGSLVPTLESLRNSPRRPKIVLGLRDILDRPNTVRRTWVREGIYDVIDRYYDNVLIYGRQDIFDTAAEYGLDRIAPDRVRYCGYLSSEEPVLDRDAARAKLELGAGKLVVITAGGGADAYPMMDACVSALSRIEPRDRPDAIMITGPLMGGDERVRLENRARGLPIRVLSHTCHNLNYISAADLTITMGGYNTLVECLRLGKPTVVVPREGPSTEQTTRARVFAEMGLVTTVELGKDTPKRLSQAIRENLATPRPAANSLGPNGVAEAVRHLMDGLGQDTVPAKVPVALEAR